MTHEAKYRVSAHRMSTGATRLLGKICDTYDEAAGRGDAYQLKSKVAYDLEIVVERTCDLCGAWQLAEDLVDREDFDPSVGYHGGTALACKTRCTPRDDRAEIREAEYHDSLRRAWGVGGGL